MNSKWIKLLAVMFALSLVAAACGSDSADEDAADTGNGDDEALTEAQDALSAAQDAATAAQADAETAEAEAAAAVAAAESGDDVEVREFEGKVIRLTGSERSAEEWGSIEEGMIPFEEATGAEVIFTGSANWEAEINVQIAAGNPPDVSIFPQPGKLADFARSGAVLPLPPEVEASARENWSDSNMEFGLIDDVQYGIPAKTDLKSLVWYKPDVFAAGGYEVPTTWQALLDLTDQMIADGTTPWCVGIESGTATGWVMTDWTEELMLRINGPEDYDAWVANDLKFSDPKVVAIFDEILGLWRTPGAVFGGVEAIVTSHHSSDPAEGLAADNCAMVRQASFFASFLPEGTTDVDWFYFPAVDDTSAPVLVGGNLTGAFTDKPEVWALMEYMGGGEYANARQVSLRALKGGGISGFNTANLNADPSLWSEVGASHLAFMQNAEVVRFDGADLMPADVGSGEFWTQATAMVNGDTDTVAAAAAIDAAWPTDG
jgi:alpha-glucoside transport system substrate-binding protein